VEKFTAHIGIDS